MTAATQDAVCVVTTQSVFHAEAMTMSDGRARLAMPDGRVIELDQADVVSVRPMRTERVRLVPVAESERDQLPEWLAERFDRASRVDGEV